MTIENEKSKQVSNRKLLTDIENTEKESAAYREMANGNKMILSGLKKLLELPELDETDKGNLGYQIITRSGLEELYQEKAKQCDLFLSKLKGTSKERGLS